MGSLKGETLAFREKRETLTIHWKQGSIAGWGWDKHQTYVLCEYATPNGYSVPIYIQEGKEIKQNFTIDFRFQYGTQDNVLFFVYHDKSQTPYQERFRCNGLQKFAYAANELLKMAGVDLSWISGNYLKDVWNELSNKLCVDLKVFHVENWNLQSKIRTYSSHIGVLKHSLCHKIVKNVRGGGG